MMEERESRRVIYLGNEELEFHLGVLCVFARNFGSKERKLNPGEETDLNHTVFTHLAAKTCGPTRATFFCHIMNNVVKSVRVVELV